MEEVPGCPGVIAAMESSAARPQAPDPVGSDQGSRKSRGLEFQRAWVGGAVGGWLLGPTVTPRML